MSLRRLPVYILADCSGSMNGNPIESVKSGIRALHSELMGDPSAVESTYLSVITFDSNAQQIVPLTELSQFNSPDLRAGGTTAFGAALKLLMEAMEREVKKNTPEEKGDWKPLVFVFTDGEPTDRWEQFADDLKSKRPGNVIAVACGDRAVPQVLKRVTDNVLIMKDMSPDAFKQFFKWVSASIKQTSQKVGGAGGGAALAQGVSLPPPPPEIVIHP
jgi:uncharacterized protein YegL